MIILSIKTDSEESEVGLFDNHVELGYISWHAHRTLADDIHHKIKELLDQNSLSWPNIEGVVGFLGPGSFTGLRIGLSVANAISYANQAPIVGTIEDNWLQTGITKLINGENHKILVPEYGAEPNITKPRK